MSQPERPHEQIPYPTAPDPAQPQPAAENAGADTPPSLPPEWPDVPWTPDSPTATPWTPATSWSPSDTPGGPSGATPARPAAPEGQSPPGPGGRNPWKWVAAGLAILLLILVAGIVGRVTAPSQPAATQAAPSPAPLTDPDQTYGQAPQITPDPSSPDTFTPAPGSPPTFYSGRGNASVTITKDPGPAIVQFECDKCTGNTVLKSNGPESVLVNTVGSYSGRRPIDLQEGSSTTTINVGASSDWRMTVSSGLGAARASVEGAPLTGQGDDVVIMNGSATKAHVTNTGASGFIVYVVPVQSATVSLAVNTVGAYDGTVALSAPAVVIVQSTGAWTITPS
ncbi:MAG TPA: hypothetical protein VL595_15025 [Pseudonocardia sp.]|jgi:hypothetical protein|nr:hypothetical protein [Pseudonocardia sp.]